MSSLLNRLFGRRKGSGQTAKDRLRFVLQYDRINLPPERMEEMKRDILSVIMKYVVVDKDRVEIAMEQRDRNHSRLVAEVPVVKQVVPPSPESLGETRDSMNMSPAKKTNAASCVDRDDATVDDDEDDSSGKMRTAKADKKENN